MIWLKRLSPLIVAVLLWFGYSYWTESREMAQLDEQEKLSLAIAKIWIATALYRDNPVRYAEFRDSVLEAAHMSQDELFEYIRQFEGKEEHILPLATRIQDKVDSLHALEIDRIDKLENPGETLDEEEFPNE